MDLPVELHRRIEMTFLKQLEVSRHGIAQEFIVRGTKKLHTKSQHPGRGVDFQLVSDQHFTTKTVEDLGNPCDPRLAGVILDRDHIGKIFD